MKNRSAFTVLELVFVIAVIGILSAIAVPKFAATRNDAVITKAVSTVAAVRNAIVAERNKRTLKGQFDDFKSLGGQNDLYGSIIFDYFDGDSNDSRILEYGIRTCKNSSAKGCWIKKSNTRYDYIMPSGTHVIFKFDTKSRFDCSNDNNHTTECKRLSE